MSDTSYRAELTRHIDEYGRNGGWAVTVFDGAGAVVETFAVEESAELADGTPAAIAAAFSPRYAVTEADLGAIDADHWVIGDLRRA